MIGKRHADPLGLPAAPDVAESAAEDGASGRGALGRKPALAPLALTAGDREGHDHPIAAPHLLDRRTEVFDRAHELVTHHGAGLDERAAATVILVQVRAADRAGGDLQDDVGRIDALGLGHVLHAHVADAMKRDGFHRVLREESSPKWQSVMPRLAAAARAGAVPRPIISVSRCRPLRLYESASSHQPGCAMNSETP